MAAFDSAVPDNTVPGSPAATLQPRCVVVIDDSEVDAALLTMRLQGHYPSLQAVHWLNDGQRVLEQVAQLAPDLVISDFHMPGYDLLATLRALRERWPLLPLLVMSGLVGEEAAVQVLKAGANDFLPKSRSERLPQVIARELAEAEAHRKRDQLQAELALQHRVNEAIFEQASAGLWIMSPDGVIERTNPHGRHMMGGEPQLDIAGLAAIQGWWVDTGLPIDSHDWPGAQALEQRRHVPPRLMRVRTHLGEMRYFRCGAAPLTAPDGSHLGAVITATDLSDEVLLQERLREAEAGLRSLSLNQNALHERQMVRIARDLHDNLGQVLSLLKLHLASAARADLAPQRRATELDEALPLVDLALHRLREVCNDLGPSELADFGLGAALASMCNAAARAGGLAVEATVEGMPRAVDMALQRALFRIAQAALTNALRHADAVEVRVQLLWRDDALTLEVADNGCGFDLNAVRAPTQHGLRSMRERMELLGGTLNVESNPGNGTLVRARVPLPPAPGGGAA
jgi:two-component system, NarL family, sensor histidine kinase UhpB